MSIGSSPTGERSYFNNPLIEDSLLLLPAAVDFPSSDAFQKYLVENLHHSALATRKRFASYICQRFSDDGQMNLALAHAVKKFGDSRISREILYFELLLAAPVLREVASLWLSEQPDTGGSRASLNAFLTQRHPGKNVNWIAKATLTTFRRCNKIESSSRPVYVPVWSEPPLEAFLYVLARLYPQRTMVRFDTFAGQPVIRALLWPRPRLAPLLEKARLAGHISKISELDQYHQFTLADAGSARLERLVGSPYTATSVVREPDPAYTAASSAAASPLNRGTSKAKPRAGTLGTRKGTPKNKSKGRKNPSPRQLSLVPRED